MAQMTLAIGGVAVAVQVDREVVAEAHDFEPLAFALYVTPDAVARIYGVEKIEKVKGKQVYTLAFIYGGDDLGRMHRFAPRHVVAEDETTWDGHPALLGVVEDPSELGFDDATMERLVRTGLVMSGRGYKARPRKRVRRVVRR